MKPFLFIVCTICAGVCTAQPTTIEKAIISTTMTVIAPDEDDASNIQTQDAGRSQFNFRNFGDGETKTTTYLKGSMVKTVAKTDMGRTTIIRDNDQKLTTTLLEMMGNKTGFFITDEEQVSMRKSMDSAMRARQKDSANLDRRQSPQPAQVNVSHTEETKKIAGYVCKKAYVITTRILGLKDTSTVWYAPDFKLNTSIASLAGGMATMFGGNSGSSPNNGFDQIDGFVMRYETKMRRNRTMIIEVNKIELNKDIAAKEFEIPRDFDVKPMKEMRNMMSSGQGMQFQIRRDN